MRPLRSVIALVSIAACSFAQSWQPPAESHRCPCKWGPGDERGSANHMKPESVLRAARLIRTGEVFELGQVLSPSMPLQSTRQFNVHLKRTSNLPGINRRGSNEEVVMTELGQVGTQFDGFAHQTIGGGLYNCFQLDEIATRNGFSKLGIHKVGMLMTRGVVIDVAGYKGVDQLPASYEITVADLEAALQKQNTKLQPGDAILIRTGWSTLWSKDGARYFQNSPGIGTAAAEWLARQDPMLLGADNPSVELTPYPDPKLNLPVHQIMLVVHGIHLLENLKLEDMAAKRVYESAFMLQPLKIEGATGSTVAPVAIR